MKYDYVLVGGGTSACVLACELIERELGTVAVIESGCVPRGPRIFTPVRYPDTFASRWDYGLETEPQPNLAHRRIAWPRGKMLGGSSGLNAMIYIPPCREDLESWPTTWNFDDVSPFIEKIESRLFTSDYAQPDIHPMSQRFLHALEEENRALIDRRSKLDEGLLEITPVRFRRTQSNGRRRTAFTAFLKPILGHPKLTIIENATVSRINMTGSTAKSVEFSSQSDSSTIEANEAVVLTAGTIFSPAILMKSGFGPKDQLREHLIDLKMDLPGVGKNLQDHLIVPLVFESQQQFSLEKQFTESTRLQYVRSRTGDKASNIAEVGAFMNVALPAHSTHSISIHQTIQLHFTPTHYLEYPTRESPASAYTIGVTQCNPLSSGEIRTVPGSDSNYGVSIDPRYLCEPFDLEVLKAAIAHVLTIADQPSLSKLEGSKLVLGGFRKTGNRDEPQDKQIERLIRRYALTLYHPVGTCAIGEHDQAVVDHQLRVRGTENLYVADSSIIPKLPRGNPQSFAMLVGYQAANILESL